MAPPAALSGPHRARAPAGARAAAGVWLIVYLALFLRMPLVETARGAVSRFEFAWVALVRPDDLARAWLADFTVQALWQRALILAAAGSIALVALAAGWTALRALGVDRAVTRLEMSVFSLAAGLNLVSLATLLLGLAGGLRFDIFAALAAATLTTAAVVYARTGCASGTCVLASAPAEAEDAERPRPGRRWGWLALPFIGCTLLAAVQPPVDFDVREYHAQAPKEFYQAGRIAFLPHNVYGNMPLGAEMLSLAAMVALGDWWTGAIVGITLGAAFAPLAAAGLYAACCRFASPAAGTIAAVAYLSIPWIAHVSATGLIDGALACYLFLAGYAVLLWQQAAASGLERRSRAGLLALAGFLSGAAVSTKYPAVLFSTVPLAAFVGWQAAAGAPVRRAARRAAAPLAVFLLAVICGCGPWFAKNFWFTGNPTYPLLAGVFVDSLRTPEQQAQWNRAHRPDNFSPADLARRTWHALVTSRWLSPLVVPLAVLALAARHARQLVLWAGGYLAFLFFSWWLLTHRIDRFLVPALPLAALLAGVGATWTAGSAWRRMLAAFLTMTLAYNFLVIAGGLVASNRYFADLEALRRDPDRVAPWHRYFNEHVGDVERLLLVGDAQPFDLEVPVIYNTVFDAPIFERLARGRTPQQVQSELRSLGISHVYVSWSEIARYRSPGNYGLSDFLQPRVFDELVAAGVLEPLGVLADDSGRGYRVR